jgi:hypothetical protein
MQTGLVWNMRYVFLAMLISTAVASEQVAVSHFASSCLHVTENTWAEAPLKDGQPDFDHVVVYKLSIDKGCGMIQVKRAK